jgi:methanogenic corrinoid protein MtbC1
MTQGEPGVYKPVLLDRDAIALKLYNRFLEKHPEIYQEYSAYLKAQTLEGFRYHLLYLQEALAIDDAAVFIDSVGWGHIMLLSLHIPDDGLSSSLEVLKEVLHEELPDDLKAKSDDIISKSIAFLATAPTEVPSNIREDNPLAMVAHEYLDALLIADRVTAMKIIDNQVKLGVAIRDIFLRIFQPVLRELGRLWQIQKISVAQEHYATATTQLLLARLYQNMMIESQKVKRRGKTVVAVCVSGELHEMGVRMVADFFEMDGWNTYFIGANTPEKSLISAVKERKADLVALSSTMSFHLPWVDKQIRALRQDPDTRHVKIIIGGYPFNIVPGLWQKIGADAYAGSADEAVEAGNRLVT